MCVKLIFFNFLIFCSLNQCTRFDIKKRMLREREVVRVGELEIFFKELFHQTLLIKITNKYCFFI